MKTPEQIATETAEKLNKAFNLYAWGDSKREAAGLVLAALTEHAKELEEENARRRFPHPELYNTRKLLGDVTAERDQLSARVAELESQLNDTREYGARMQRERDDRKWQAKTWEEVAGQHCADAARLEKQLHALRLVCGTTDANKFETALDRANERIKELEAQLEDAASLAERERAERQKDVGSQEYRGNTVAYMYDKAKCYGDMVHGCTPALVAAGFPPEEFAKDGQVGAIARAVEAMAKRMAQLELQTFDIKKLEADNTRLRDALTRLRDCDWVISLPDRMDAVRNIARDALAPSTEAKP